MIEQGGERLMIAITQPADIFLTNAGIQARKIIGASVNEQVRKIIETHTLNQQGEEPVFLVLAATGEEFLKAAERELTTANGNSRGVKECFESLTLIVPESEIASDALDPTGIRVRMIKKGEIRFPTHPTPDS